MPFKARKAVFDKLLEVADVASLSRDERIQSIKQSGDSLRRSRLIFLNYLPVITRLFHDYLPDCLAGLDDVEAGGQIAAVQAGDRAEVVQQPSVGGDDADGRNGIRVGACAVKEAVIHRSAAVIVSDCPLTGWVTPSGAGPER